MRSQTRHAALCIALAALGCSGGDPTSPGVESATESLPPAGAAYHGAGPHGFSSGAAQLTCSSHGQFTAAVAPPLTPGVPVIADYFATFTGQLVLAPPLVTTATTIPISLPAHMVEQITLTGTQGAVRTFDAELLTFEVGISVRESPSLASTGRTTITTLSRGGYRIETYYDVWLEISLDAGVTWRPAESVVRMTLGVPTP